MPGYQNEIERTSEIAPLSFSEREQYINYLYRFLLKRSPSQDELNCYQQAKLNELELFQSFIDSPEFIQRHSVEVKERQDYLKCLYQILLQRNPTPEDLSQYADNQESYYHLLTAFANSEEYVALKARTSLDLQQYLGCSTYILGEPTPIRPSQLVTWYRTISTSLLQKGFINTQGPEKTKKSDSEPLDPLVTIVTSLYQGGKYIRNFLENITQQTIFDQCQLFIVDANSPEKESEAISPYLKIYPDNIVYHRLDRKVSIYEAWNIVIENSCSPYITNANLDDCHRQDALEIKLQALVERPDVDVVYSDVYYSFLENLPFDVIAEGGVHTHLPIADKFNLLHCNSPHNAPLWRRRLHDKIGLFDCGYRSAGDLDFWMRAALADCQFFKIQEIVTAYYHNPEGLSTHSKGIARQEMHQLQEHYQALLQA